MGERSELGGAAKPLFPSFGSTGLAGSTSVSSAASISLPGGVPGSAAWMSKANFSSSTPAGGTRDGHDAAHLLRAADYFLPSSSSDSDSEGEEAGERGKPVTSDQAGSSGRAPQGAEVADAAYVKQPGQADAPHKNRSKDKRKRETHERKHRKHKKRLKTDHEKMLERDRRAIAAGDYVRSSRAAWAARSRPDADAQFCVDARGDRDNIVYDGLYQTDVPQFHRIDPLRTAAGAKPRYGLAYGRSFIEAESQGVQPNRYYLMKHRRREQSHRLKRFYLAQPAARSQAKPHAGSKLPLPQPVFMPLKQDEGADAGPGAGETAEQALMRRSREFNVATRERPHDLQTWLDFAAFQDEVAHGTARMITEKKIAIVEKGLSFLPGAEDLLLALLQLAGSIGEREAVQRRWEHLLQRYPGSLRLWRAYLQFCLSHSEAFRVIDIRSAYLEALQALRGERARRVREGAPAEEVVRVERGLAEVLVELVRFELQAGHTERAVARIQAAFEYTCFPPLLPPGNEGLKRRQFQEFWESAAPIIGETGGGGWGAWYLNHHFGVPLPAAQPATAAPQLQAAAAAGDVVVDDHGWSGWEYETAVDLEAEPAAGPADAEAAIDHHSEAEAEEAADRELEEHEEDEEGVQDDDSDSDSESETEEQMRERIGRQFDEAMATAGAVDMQRWAAMERAQDGARWRPRRDIGADFTGREDETDTQDLIEFQQVEDGCFDLGSEAARWELVVGCLELLGAPMPPWRCTNSTAWLRAQQAAVSLHHLHGARLLPAAAAGSADAAAAAGDEDALKWLRPGQWGDSGEAAAWAELPWYLVNEERRQFVARLLAQLVGGPFAEDEVLCSTLMQVEAAVVTPSQNAPPTLNAPIARVRSTAKALLAEHRSSLPLWAAFARAEAGAMQPKAARRVYDAALASLPTLPPSAFQQAPAMVLAYAEMEVAKGGADAAARALHVLLWLGRGGAFAPYNATGFREEELVQGRKGYQEMLSAGLAAEIAPDVGQAARIAAAALYEQLLPAVRAPATPGGQSGMGAAAAVLRQSLVAVPAAARRQSAQCEALQLRLCSLLARASAADDPAVPPKRAHAALLEALQDFPRSPELVALLSEVEQRGHTLSRLRRELTLACAAHAAPALWLLALALEARRPASAPLVETLFGKALLAKGPLEHCPLLWRCRVAFKLYAGHKDTLTAWHAATHDCPQAKLLWLDGLGHRLWQNEDIVAELENKGLRVRTTIQAAKVASTIAAV